ncbi:cysteine hydrolase [Streptomyces sp. HNM0575]|uniref:isochorismatase family cysteine hydrolase n=1 Tax=Streptomyces sp. HNM0575 TaxID=2716338 RepID=UPI00145E16B0|nr:isochorismatase family cysteine hydrolase [Streptomyces sp. HNM0575]NLU72678.1 cysteine hydrolase [Streptomyces sp. HNM0575]
MARTVLAAGGSPASALIVVDMQNGFIAPYRGAGVEGARSVLTAVNRWISHAHERSWPVFLTRDIDPFGSSGPGARHDVALHPGLDARGTVVDKGPGSRAGFSGFVLASTATEGPGAPGGGGLSELAGLLLREGVEDVVTVGLAADVCVSATALDARRLGYRVTLDLDATAFVHAHPDGDEAAVAALAGAGVTVLGGGPEEAP